MAASNNKIYYEDLDVARGVLMALGVVLHSANIFAPGAPAPVHSSAPHAAFLYLSEAIHLFRMPAFFAVSGFFCWMSLKTYSPPRFLSLRSKRILVPLITTAVTFNALELWLRAKSSSGISFMDYTVSGELLQPYLAGEWLLHLWFLVVVFAYFFASAALAHVLDKTPSGWLDGPQKLLSGALAFPVLVVGAGTIAAYLPVAAGKIAPEIVFSRISFRRFDIHGA